MRIAIDQIEDAPKHLAYGEDAGPLNERLDAGPADFRLAADVAVDVEYYRAGGDVVVQGALHVTAQGRCSRCLEAYPVELDVPIRVLLSPRSAVEEPEEDEGLSFHDGVAIDVTALVQEQLLLALPTRALCRDDCAGLCPACGANRNAGPCDCAAAPPSRPFAGLGMRTREQ